MVTQDNNKDARLRKRRNKQRKVKKPIMGCLATVPLRTYQQSVDEDQLNVEIP